MKRSIAITEIAAALALGGCASPPPSHSASLATFGAPSLKDIFAPPQKPAPARRPAASAPKSPASECGAVPAPRCLLDKGVIGGRHE